MFDNLLSFLIVFAAIETLYLIFFNENDDENILIILDDYQKPKAPQLRTLPFYESDEYEYLPPDKEIIEIPSSSYDIEQINECYLLLDEYSDCLNKNAEDYDCKKLIENKLSEFKKCDLIYTSISPSSSLEDETCDKIYDIKYNINDIFQNIEDEDLKYLNNNNNNNEDKIEIEEMNNKKEEMFQEIIKDSFIMKNDKDCVEYELSEEDENVIKCAKYE